MTGLLALVLATFIAGNFAIAPNRAVARTMLGHDFLPFYAAGTLARQGQFDRLYDLGTLRQLERQIAEANDLALGQSFGPFWNPPFYAWLFAPLSALPYPTALNLWLGVNLAALAGAIVLLVRMLPMGAREDRQNGLLITLLVCMSMPFIQAITHAQNTCISLLLLCGVVTAWRAQRDLLAGVLCGVMFYKPQLAVILAGMLILTRGRRALLGILAVLGPLALITVITMPGAIAQYAHRLPLILRHMQIDQPYLWERHVTLKAMWRLLIQGRDAGEPAMLVTVLTAVSAAAIGAGLFWLIWRDRRASADDVFTGETRFIRRDRLIAATIVAMPLVMPFYFDYDLLLLSVAAVLLAGDVMVRAPGLPVAPSDRLLIGALVALYAWTLINPIAAGLWRVNGSVMILVVVAAMLIVRAGRHIQPEQFSLHRPQVIRVTARRAA